MTLSMHFPKMHHTCTENIFGVSMWPGCNKSHCNGIFFWFCKNIWSWQNTTWLQEARVTKVRKVIFLKLTNLLEVNFQNIPKGRIRARNCWTRTSRLRHLGSPRAPIRTGHAPRWAERVCIKNVIEITKLQFIVVIIWISKFIHINSKTKVIVSIISCLMIIEGCLNCGLKTNIYYNTSQG